MKTLREIRDELAQTRADDSISPHTTIYDVRAGFDSGFKAAIELMRSEEGKVWSRQTFKEQMIYNLMDVSEWLESKLEQENE